MNYNYRKTILKNPRLNEDKNIIITFAFLKAISRSINLGFKLVFIDETGFCLNNVNLKMWRKSGEEIIAGPKADLKRRINLIMAIDNNEIIYGHIYINEIIGIKKFIDFLKEMLERLDKSNLNKTIFILDNASYHTGKKIKKFVEDNQLKFLFTIQYIRI